ncbi:MAG: GDP-mannose 4,6-dehydratase [Candidatus Binatia bacterium]
MRFFLTGISGFAGVHLAELLLGAGHEVSGIAIEGWSPRLETIAGGRILREAVAETDLRDAAGIRTAIERARPDGVFHLAGITSVPQSNADPRAAYEVNLFGTLAVLDAMRSAAPRARAIIVTSAEIYGRVDPAELPITERQALRPLSPYGVSKAAADLAAQQAHLVDGLDAIRVRPFNHTGPGQAPIFVCSEFARAVAAAEAGKGPSVLRVGNLDVERDFSDVRDVVRGYRALFERGRAGEAYNLASGRTTTIRAVLDRLVAKSRVAISVETDPAKVRPREAVRMVASIERAERDAGWRPEIPLERTLDDLLEWWRAELSR